jgi:hypothetical protein
MSLGSAVSDETGKSDAISDEAPGPRRRLVEEVLEARSRVVAHLEPLDDDPPASSWQWPVGIARLAARAHGRSIENRRAIARDVAVVALAWLERIDEELGPERGAGGE